MGETSEREAYAATREGKLEAAVLSMLDVLWRIDSVTCNAHHGIRETKQCPACRCTSMAALEWMKQRTELAKLLGIGERKEGGE